MQAWSDPDRSHRRLSLPAVLRFLPFAIAEILPTDHLKHSLLDPRQACSIRVLRNFVVLFPVESWELPGTVPKAREDGQLPLTSPWLA